MTVADKYLIFDSETQITKAFKRKANPFIEENYVVARGWKKQGDTHCTSQFFVGKSEDNYLHISDDVEVIVGHNIKFDLLYEMANNNPSLKKFFKRGGRVWCTQYAEYLLRHMQRKYHMNSMDSIIEDYGGRKKIDGMQELWDAGVQTSDIEPDMVNDYLIGTEAEGRNSGDIGNTERIYLGQLKDAVSQGMLQAIKLRMDGLCATTEMEYNGLKICIATAMEDLERLNKELADATTALDVYTKAIPDIVGFSWSSPVCKSAIIYGGVIRYQVSDTYLDETTGELARLKAKEAWPLFDKVPKDPRECEVSETGHYFYRENESFGAGMEEACDVVYQDTFLGGKRKGEPKFKQVPVPGELKRKKQDRFYTLDGFCDADELGINKTQNTDGRGNPLYSTDSDTMELLGKHSDVPFLKALSEKTRLDKEIGTYYVTEGKNGELKGMLTCVSPIDHIIHHMLNHTSTVTSRLSSSNPNCQNIPKSPSRVKAMFVSRFPGGKMAEIDYSQLEVVVQGLLSRDKQLVEDLNNRVDFHCKRVSAKFDIPYEDALVWCKDETYKDFPLWKARRNGVKEFSFQRAYGAGASAIALATGMPKVDIEALIISEEKLYPGIVTFNADVEKEVNASAEGFRDAKMGYRPFRRGTWQSPTGTIYSWRSWDAPKFLKDTGITDSFSPPELKNYPVQGTGGEIVQIALGVLWRWFVSTDNFNGRALLVNTVHDCVWFDMQADVVDIVIPGAVKIMEAIPMYLEMYFGIDCPVPFPVDAEVGDNMLDLHHYEMAA